jgi:hypothetical protein
MNIALFDHPHPTEYLSDAGQGVFLGVSSNMRTNILLKCHSSTKQGHFLR